MSSQSRIKAAVLALFGVAVLGIALSGCSSADLYLDRRETVVPYAGDAKAINQVTMMVDPWPPYSANRNIAFNGERMQGAVERYRTRNVIPPVNATTSSVAYTQAQQAAQSASNSQASSAPNGKP